MVQEHAPKIEFNKEKPRRGCFEVRMGDEIIVSLLGLKRPFVPLRELELEPIAKMILTKV